MAATAHFDRHGIPIDGMDRMDTPTEPHTVEKTTISMKTEHGDDAAIESIRRNWPILSALVIIVSLSAVGHYRISEMSVTVEDMRKNGHIEHERRITQLESQRADQTAMALNQLTRQVSDMVVAFTRDHDALMRMVVMYERFQPKSPGQ